MLGPWRFHWHMVTFMQKSRILRGFRLAPARPFARARPQGDVCSKCLQQTHVTSELPNSKGGLGVWQANFWGVFKEGIFWFLAARLWKGLWTLSGHQLQSWGPASQHFVGKKPALYFHLAGLSLNFRQALYASGLSCDGKPQLPVAAAKNSRFDFECRAIHVGNDKHHWSSLCQKSLGALSKTTNMKVLLRIEGLVWSTFLVTWAHVDRVM